MTTKHEDVPPWERDEQWYKAELERLKLERAHYKERAENGERAFGNELAMPRPSLLDYFAGELMRHALELSEENTDVEDLCDEVYKLARQLMAARARDKDRTLAALKLAAASVELREAELALERDDDRTHIVELQGAVTAANEAMIAMWSPPTKDGAL